MPAVALQRGGYRADVTRVAGVVNVAVMKPGDRNGVDPGAQSHEVVRWRNVNLAATVAALHTLFDPMFLFSDVDITAIKAVVV